ncbi:hypothetical protein QR680_019012 [Steinernema hermaphroditum]|uniref:Uncharacterized protein n=1 Tax=Steinernema hermaphroditum TaxID=289476 RepID=A0AA39HJQ1_9BILA|nr:hypothetical protein QR680_019012 [Steinernema hermaphroditum]
MQSRSPQYDDRERSIDVTGEYSSSEDEGPSKRSKLIPSPTESKKMEFEQFRNLSFGKKNPFSGGPPEMKRAEKRPAPRKSDERDPLIDRVKTFLEEPENQLWNMSNEILKDKLKEVLNLQMEHSVMMKTRQEQLSDLRLRVQKIQDEVDRLQPPKEAPRPESPFQNRSYRLSPTYNAYQPPAIPPASNFPNPPPFNPSMPPPVVTETIGGITIPPHLLPYSMRPQSPSYAPPMSQPPQVPDFSVPPPGYRSNRPSPSPPYVSQVMPVFDNAGLESSIMNQRERRLAVTPPLVERTEEISDAEEEREPKDEVYESISDDE